MDDVRGFLSQPEYSEFNIACTKSSNPETVQFGEGVGLRINGCPVGDDKFAHHLLDKTTYAAGATIKK
jgi:hypothetical protein